MIFFFNWLRISHRFHFCVLECTLMKSMVCTARRIFFFGGGGGGGGGGGESPTFMRDPLC